jgi:hypothetical protein
MAQTLLITVSNENKSLLRCRKYICLFIAMLLASKKAFNILTKKHLKTKKTVQKF